MNACVECRAGWHLLCEVPIDGTLCCCGKQWDLRRASQALDVEEAEARGVVAGTAQAHQALTAKELRDEEGSGGGERASSSGPRVALDVVPGYSGYIHADAWASPADLGELADPKSTGRKRVARMYPIRGGQVCEWSRKTVSLQGKRLMIGCLNNPASDAHHGPDKNTLNNAKASLGIGDTENVWLLCSECHNEVHAVMDPTYPEYDRVKDQAAPWLPAGVTLGESFVLGEASNEELWNQDVAREQQRTKRGREHRGRNAEVRPGVTEVQPD